MFGFFRLLPRPFYGGRGRSPLERGLTLGPLFVLLFETEHIGWGYC